MSINTEQLVEAYINLREQIAIKEEAHKNAIRSLKEDQQKVSDALLEICLDQNADSIKTSAGTVSRRLKERYWASDWEEFYAFLLEQEAPELLEKRVHSGNLREFKELNPDVNIPGLEVDRRYEIQVRKPTNK